MSMYSILSGYEFLEMSFTDLYRFYWESPKLLNPIPKQTPIWKTTIRVHP